ncbi:MAG: VOC family protein [Caulobacteraceae bacterium]
MEQRLSLVTLGVRDLDASRRFYERLGWTRSVRAAEGVAFFRAGGVVLSLYPRDQLAADAQLSPEGDGFCGFALAHNVGRREEVDSALAEAVQAGALLLKPAQEAFWGGYSGYFADPDGFPWEVAWNPGFPLGDDGVLQLPD